MTTEQCEILRTLLEGGDPPERTTEVLAWRLNMRPRQVASGLEELQARSPPLVRVHFDEEWRVRAWAPTEAARPAHDDSCGPEVLA